MHPYTPETIRKQKEAQNMSVRGVTIALGVVLVFGAGVYTHAWERLGALLTARGTIATASSTLSATTTVLDDPTDVVAQVRALMQVPDEVPTITRVADIDAHITSQPFFSGAESTDVLLVFPHTGKAVLYSTAQHKILNAGPIQYEDTLTQAEQTQATSTAPKR